MNYQVTREEERSLRNTIIKRAGKQEKQKQTLIQVEEVEGGCQKIRGGQGSQAAPTKPRPDPLTGRLSSHSCLKNKTKHHPPENFIVQRAHRTNER